MVTLTKNIDGNDIFENGFLLSKIGTSIAVNYFYVGLLADPYTDYDPLRIYEKEVTEVKL